MQSIATDGHAVGKRQCIFRLMQAPALRVCTWSRCDLFPKVLFFRAFLPRQRPAARVYSRESAQVKIAAGLESAIVALDIGDASKREAEHEIAVSSPKRPASRNPT
jgi:hypothetical protein